MILICLGLAALFWAGLSVTRGVSRAVGHVKGASLPETFKKISYVLLIVLMFGVVTGGFAGL